MQKKTFIGGHQKTGCLLPSGILISLMSKEHRPFSVQKEEKLSFGFTGEIQLSELCISRVDPQI